MKETLFVLGTAVATLLASSAFAQEPPEGPIGRDTDGDGFISRSEVSAQSQRGFERLDSNGDGTISFEEFDAVSQARFERIDTNDDDLLSTDEIESVREQRGERRGRFRNRRGN
ncbi:MAG: hypothetical protein AAFX52_03480 [Pseudomonadota bacterium]